MCGHCRYRVAPNIHARWRADHRVDTKVCGISLDATSVLDKGTAREVLTELRARVAAHGLVHSPPVAWSRSVPSGFAANPEEPSPKVGPGFGRSGA
jgi:hypothetical protein